MSLLFSYGTLQLPDVQHTAFGRRLEGRHDSLRGFTPGLVPIDDAGVAARLGRAHHVNAIFSGNATDLLPGTAFEVTDAELTLADQFEAPFAYARVRAVLASGGSTWVYVHAPPEPCADCGARYAAGDSCASRLEALLALDHSHQEPWGSRHGEAFAAFALQHPAIHVASVDRAWTTLYRIYVRGELSERVFRSVRRYDDAAPLGGDVPPRPPQPVTKPAVTIADLGDFGAGAYPGHLDAWCRATLAAWGARVEVRS